MGHSIISSADHKVCNSPPTIFFQQLHKLSSFGCFSSNFDHYHFLRFSFLRFVYTNTLFRFISAAKKMEKRRKKKNSVADLFCLLSFIVILSLSLSLSLPPFLSLSLSLTPSLSHLLLSFPFFQSPSHSLQQSHTYSLTSTLTPLHILFPSMFYNLCNNHVSFFTFPLFPRIR